MGAPRPVLSALRNAHPDALLSIDTFHASVARRALDAGADLINDVSGGDADPDMWKVVADARAPYVMMHMQGTPETMQANPTYHDVVSDVYQNLQTKLFRAYDAGLTDVIVDVGFGFGKTVAHNYALLDALPEFLALQCPVLVGVSRKSMIQKVLEVSSDDALNGTTALHAWAVDEGRICCASTMWPKLPRWSPCTRHCEIHELRRSHDDGTPCI